MNFTSFRLTAKLIKRTNLQFKMTGIGYYSHISLLAIFGEQPTSTKRFNWWCKLKKSLYMFENAGYVFLNQTSFRWKNTGDFYNWRVMSQRFKNRDELKSKKGYNIFQEKALSKARYLGTSVQKIRVYCNCRFLGLEGGVFIWFLEPEFMGRNLALVPLQ